MDYYKILKISEDATLKQIDQAYKDLSSFYNPENNISPSSYKKYREITKAYEVLKEIKQREMYDLTRKDIVIENTKEKDDSKVYQYQDFTKNNYSKINKDISKYKDAIIEDEFSNYQVLNYNISYLYYLLECLYQVEFNSKEIITSEEICPLCKGIGKVKENEKVVYCKECFGSGKKTSYITVSKQKKYKVESQIIDKENKLIINFNFIDKENIKVNGNEINVKYLVNEDEYYNGIKLELDSEKEKLVINKTEFNDLKEKYVYLDKVINVEYVLSSFKGRDKKGYIVTDQNCIYLNLKYYTYSFKPSSECNFKVEIKEKKIVLDKLGNKGYKNDNGDLILEVINLKNEDDLRIFFDLEVRKVSPRVFKFLGNYNNHQFNFKKLFDYDDKYLYIPSLAYSLKLKNYKVFNLIFILGYLIVPLILFIILGISYAFFIASFSYLVVYLVVINLLMEVKI